MLLRKKLSVNFTTSVQANSAKEAVRGQGGGGGDYYRKWTSEELSAVLRKKLEDVNYKKCSVQYAKGPKAASLLGT